MYIELHTASAFSFLQGASLPETLIERAADLGYPVLALLDRDGVYGAPRFHRAALAAGIRPIVGAELTIGDRTRPGHDWLLPVLCESQVGYQNLCRLITQAKLSAPKGEARLTLEDLDGFTTGLVALAGRPVVRSDRYGVGGLLDRLVGIFGRTQVYVELQRHFRRDEEGDNRSLISLASAFRVPILATGGVRFATRAERPLFDVLSCLHARTTLADAGRRVAPNAERYLRAPEEMASLFRDLPRAVHATRDLADRLQYTMANLGYRFPDYPVPSGETQMSFLRHLVDAGAHDRYRPYHAAARAQIARELALIEQLNLAGYFLIVWDIVAFARQNGVLVQGRGSAANSAVCYSLGITAVDPVGMNLLFERFLSAERGEWPDIDLDLPSGDRRERVIQHVYARYGRHGAAMTANVITYRGRSAARDVGKVLGLAPSQIDRLAGVMNQFEYVDAGDTLSAQLASLGIDAQSDAVRHFADLWYRMQDIPRHLGQHSGGMVVCQGALDAVVPLENAAMPGRVVVQWDKDDCANMGIVKVDLLGLGMMAAMQDALTIINAAGTPLDLAHLPKDDPAVFKLMQEADTVGVFQIESRAQMATLPRLKPTCFYDLVVQVAIIRPGPIVGQMVHPYLNRRAGREPVEPLHPSLEPVLARTLGVPLFQEQLLRMAMITAGFTGGQAEELRRAMGFKRSKERMAQIEVHLREGMAANGITGETAERIITSITSFALYGFPESHAASFALLAYFSAFLKVHYPTAFYCSLLNNQPMGFYAPATLVKDAQRRGVRFEPIDVQTSEWLCAVQGNGAIRLGFRYVHGLRQDAADRIADVAPTSPPDCCPKCGSDDRSMIERIDARQRFCATCAHSWTTLAPCRFASVDELIAKAGLRRDELVTLADIGALNSLGYDRRSALWQVERAVRPTGELLQGQAYDEGAGGADIPCPLPPMTEAERLIADYAGTQLTIGRHPMALRRDELAMQGIWRAIDLRAARSGRRVRVAGLVITRQRPGTAKGFVFVTLEDETGVANVIVRPDVFTRQRLTIIEEPFLVVDGVLQSEDGVISVRAESLRGLPGPSVEFDAHDFH